MEYGDEFLRPVDRFAQIVLEAEASGRHFDGNSVSERVGEEVDAAIHLTNCIGR